MITVVKLVIIFVLVLTVILSQIVILIDCFVSAVLLSYVRIMLKPQQTT